ncbi:MAG: TrmH family RNA methyltransferase [Hyphomicrobiaceae bacterium]
MPRGTQPTKDKFHRLRVSKSADRGTIRPAPSADQVSIYGIHAVEAVLFNPQRDVRRLFITKNAERRLATALSERALAIERILPKDLDRRLGRETVHQGALAECTHLPDVPLDALVKETRATSRPVVVLDQVTDPQNVGAVLRSASAFGAAGLVMTRRHSPPLAGALAKAASGALERVSVCLVQNLARALATMSSDGISVWGLEGGGPTRFESIIGSRPAALVLGAEGKGLRQSTRAACDQVCHLATDGSASSLNVSNAAAVALYAHLITRTNAA